MNRRGFLGAILATAIAPAIVRASSLMPVVSRNPLFRGEISQIDSVIIGYSKPAFTSEGFGTLSVAQRQYWARALYREAVKVSPIARLGTLAREHFIVTLPSEPFRDLITHPAEAEAALWR